VATDAHGSALRDVAWERMRTEALRDVDNTRRCKRLAIRGRSTHNVDVLGFAALNVRRERGTRGLTNVVAETRNRP
jgi:hypothetical protein